MNGTSENSDLDRAQAQLKKRGLRLKPESDIHNIKRDTSQEWAQYNGQLQDESDMRRADYETECESFGSLSNFTDIETGNSMSFLL